MNELQDAEVIETWWVELHEDRPLAKLPWLKEIDARLCGAATIGKTDNGRFLLIWKHRHPELGTYDEYFGDGDGERDEFGLRPRVERNKERIAEWRGLRRALPSKELSKEITREEAFKTLAYFSLDTEWHPECGLV